MPNNFGSKLNTVLFLIIIGILCFSLWTVRHTANLPVIDQNTPKGFTQTNLNPNGADYQPNRDSSSNILAEKVISDAGLGVAFITMNGGIAVKGEAHCCPATWSVHGLDPANDMETLEMFIPGSTDDPKNWGIAASVGQKQYGNNTVNIYKRNDGWYAFTIVKDKKGFIVLSQQTSPKLIDLSSIVF